MIHDAQIEVTCDGENCRESVHVGLDYVYFNQSPSSGHYDSSDESIEKKIAKEHDWITKDGKHFCSESCAK